mmetsp:Transcript_68584/g.164698  ORF Transcript_68584/g.164698 Transcript_68584/m.164698 type:complete len:213 (-) Transcript_68584:204-842(-)
MPELERKENGLYVIDGGFTAQMAGNILICCFLTGQLISWPIYKFGSTAAYDEKIDLLASLNLGWLYLALPIIYYSRQLTSMNASITRNAAGLPAPHMYAFKVSTAKGKPELPYVLLEEEGQVGAANRAQRGIDNMMEYLPMYLAYVFANGFVYPFPTFVNVLFFMYSRLKYARGYTKGADERQKGFIVFGLTQMNMEGLLLIAAGKALLRMM